MKTITKKEWRETHNDFKLITDEGQKKILENRNGGTVLVPVKVKGRIEKFIDEVKEEMKTADWGELILLQDDVEQEKSDYYESTGREERHSGLCELWREITNKIEELEKQRSQEEEADQEEEKPEVIKLEKVTKKEISKAVSRLIYEGYRGGYRVASENKKPWCQDKTKKKDVVNLIHRKLKENPNYMIEVGTFEKVDGSWELEGWTKLHCMDEEELVEHDYASNYVIYRQYCYEGGQELKEKMLEMVKQGTPITEETAREAYEELQEDEKPEEVSEDTTADNNQDQEEVKEGKTKVRITEGEYKGREAVVLEARNNFNCFGRVKGGVKVQPGTAGPLVIEHGNYEVIGEVEKEEDDRFKEVKQQEDKPAVDQLLEDLDSLPEGYNRQYVIKYDPQDAKNYDKLEIVARSEETTDKYASFPGISDKYDGTELFRLKLEPEDELCREELKQVLNTFMVPLELKGTVTIDQLEELDLAPGMKIKLKTDKLVTAAVEQTKINKWYWESKKTEEGPDGRYFIHHITILEKDQEEEAPEMDLQRFAAVKNEDLEAVINSVTGIIEELEGLQQLAIHADIEAGNVDQLKRRDDSKKFNREGMKVRRKLRAVSRALTEVEDARDILQELRRG